MLRWWQNHTTLPCRVHMLVLLQWYRIWLTIICFAARSRTPGNRIVYLYTKKTGKAPKSACGICPGRLRGVSFALYPLYLLLSTQPVVPLMWLKHITNKQSLSEVYELIIVQYCAHLFPKAWSCFIEPQDPAHGEASPVDQYVCSLRWGSYSKYSNQGRL